MEYFDHCPMPNAGGSDCWEEPHPASRFGLCVRHWRKVVEDWCADQPTMNLRCTNCRTLNNIDTAELAAARCAHCGWDISAPAVILESPQIAAAAVTSSSAPRGVVYYVRFGDRIKIGYSAHLSGRMVAIPHDEVLATEPGDIAQERRRHREFSADRVEGQNEWFHVSPELLQLAVDLRTKHGAPYALARAIAEANQEAELMMVAAVAG